MSENPHAVDDRALFRKITWRLIPYIFLLYILAYLDRVNVGFAALSMQRDLHFSDAVYGTGAGIFFLGSAIFDIPSNLLMAKIGPRVWIARIMITWGILATLMMFVHSATSFYVLRFLLGVSEAGFFPGMIFYLTFWYPTAERGRAVSKFMTATSLAGVVGGPLAATLLKWNGMAGLRGWQWLFLVEGLPSVVMGVSVLFWLHDHPDDAPWLSPGEKVWLDTELARDRVATGAAERHRFADAFKLPALWVLAGMYFISQVGVYIVNLWMPLILSGFVHAGVVETGSRVARYATLPYLAAAIFTVAVGWSSDRRRERRGHIAGCLLLSAVGFGWAAVAGSLPAALGAMTLAAMGLWSMMGPFWAAMTTGVGGAAAAGGIAFLQVVGGLGGFLGPFATGQLRESTKGFGEGLSLLSAMAVVAAALCLALRPIPRTQPKRDDTAAEMTQQPR
jgi:ACS family tartrate transporter-like MFS transporter